MVDNTCERFCKLPWPTHVEDETRRAFDFEFIRVTHFSLVESDEKKALWEYWARERFVTSKRSNIRGGPNTTQKLQLFLMLRNAQNTSLTCDVFIGKLYEKNCDKLNKYLTVDEVFTTEIKQRK